MNWAHEHSSRPRNSHHISICKKNFFLCLTKAGNSKSRQPFNFSNFFKSFKSTQNRFLRNSDILIKLTKIRRNRCGKSFTGLYCRKTFPFTDFSNKLFIFIADAVEGLQRGAKIFKMSYRISISWFWLKMRK